MSEEKPDIPDPISVIDEMLKFHFDEHTSGVEKTESPNHIVKMGEIPIGQEDPDDSSTRSKVSTFSDELKFDDDVPLVVQSRYRIARSVIEMYEGDATLYDTGENPNHEWLIFLHGFVLGEVIPIPCSGAEDFFKSLRAAHEILEIMYAKGYTLANLMSRNEAGDSGLVKSHSVPVKGR